MSLTAFSLPEANWIFVVNSWMLWGSHSHCSAPPAQQEADRDGEDTARGEQQGIGDFSV